MKWELTPVAGDTKAGTLIGKDRFGNKYYENVEEELPCTSFCGKRLEGYKAHGFTVRTRWVDYKEKELDA